jgi:thioredoxin-related protein
MLPLGLMKHLLFLFSIIFLATACAKKVPEPKTYPFYIVQDNFDTTKSLALAQQKNIFLMIHADWCSVCNTFKTDVLNDASIKTFMENKIVASMIDGDKTYGKTYYDLFSVSAFPTMLVLDATGKELLRKRGTFTKEEFKVWLTPYLK